MIYTWTSVIVKGQRQGPLAKHACQLVLQPERFDIPEKIKLNSLPEVRIVNSSVIYKKFVD